MDWYVKNEQETETRMGIVSEWPKPHYLQRVLQKMQEWLQAEFPLYRGAWPEVFIEKENEE